MKRRISIKTKTWFIGLLICFSPLVYSVEVGPNIAVATQTGDQTEPSIAVNPNNPNHLIAGAIHIPSEDCRYFMSNDGGVTWSVTGLIDTDIYQSCTDPGVAFDSAGNAYFAGFFYDRNASGNFTNTRLGVARSTDGGQTYGTPSFLDGGTPTLPLVDKPHIAIDTTGSSLDGTIYLAWTTVSYNSNAREIRAAVSRNGGLTFGDINTLSDPDTNNWAAHIAIENDGNVYVAWRRFSHRVGASWPPDNQMRIAKSISAGRSWGTPTTVVELGEQADTANVDGTWRTSRYPVVALSPTQCRSKDYFCEDISGDLYCEASDCDVYVTFADDQATMVDLDTSADSVYVNDINDAGQIVGYRFTGGDQFNGFIYHQGNWETIALPGAYFTFVTGINNAGVIVGFYRDNVGNFSAFVSNRAGYANFVWSGLELTGAPPLKQIDYPGAAHTYAYAINDAAQIVGTYEDAAGVNHGFILEGDPAVPANYRTLDYPGASATEARGINEFGEIVGFYQDGVGIHHGFLLQGDPDIIANFTSIDHPDATETFALTLDNDALIVGRYITNFGQSTPLRYTRDTNTYSGYYGHTPPFTAINGINDLGEMVLSYQQSGSTYATWVAPGSAKQNIWLTSSYDGGLSWQPRVRVNDDFNGDHFDPWMCVDPKGRIHLSWLDRRDDGYNNLLYHAYYANSSDAGQSFSANTRLSTVASNPKLASLRLRDEYYQVIAGFIGDYIGLACSANAVHPAWPDMRDGNYNQNIYTARISCGLQDNGDGTVTDSCTDKMWLQNALLAPVMDWEAALAWADTLAFAGYQDWRLPRTRFPEPNCNVPSSYDIGAPPYHPCMRSELPQLANTEGIALHDIFNVPAEMAYFWSETEFQQDRPWSTLLRISSFRPLNSSSINYGIDSTYKTWSLHAWAMRDIKPGDTRAGTNVESSPAPGVTVSFTNVSAQGATTVEVSSEAPAPTPSGFEFMGNYYDITTNATYTQEAGAITVCLNYNHADIPGCTGFSCPTEEQALVIQHWNGTVWEDVTSSRDIDANIICGTVDSLSWFGLARPVPAIPGDLDGDGDIDTTDFSLFYASFGSCTGQAAYNPEADYDEDGCITFVDYQTWYGYFLNQ